MAFDLLIKDKKRFDLLRFDLPIPTPIFHDLIRFFLKEEVKPLRINLSNNLTNEEELVRQINDSCEEIHFLENSDNDFLLLFTF
jgi:hypothetical protein